MSGDETRPSSRSGAGCGSRGACRAARSSTSASSGSSSFFALTLRDSGFLTVDNQLNILRQTAFVSIMAFGTTFALSAGEIDLSIGQVVAPQRDGHRRPAARRERRRRCARRPAGGDHRRARQRPADDQAPGSRRSSSPWGWPGSSAASRAGSPASSPSPCSTTPTPTSSAPATSARSRRCSCGPSPCCSWPTSPTARPPSGASSSRPAATGSPRATRGSTPPGSASPRSSSARLTAALAGLLYVGRLHSARYTLGETDLLTVIAAAVIGGTSMAGGRGSIIGALRRLARHGRAEQRAHPHGLLGHRAGHRPRRDHHRRRRRSASAKRRKAEADDRAAAVSSEAPPAATPVARRARHPQVVQRRRGPPRRGLHAATRRGARARRPERRWQVDPGQDHRRRLLGRRGRDRGQRRRRSTPGRSGESRRRGIAMVFQEFSLIPAMSVGQNILLSREPKGRTRSHRRPRGRASGTGGARPVGAEIDPGSPRRATCPWGPGSSSRSRRRSRRTRAS